MTSRFNCPKTVLFRADGSSRIGTGHLVRCATLATELQNSGADVFLAYRAAPGLPDWPLERFPGTIFELGQSDKPPPDTGPALSHSNWLATTQQDDAMQLLGLITTKFSNHKVDWIVVDHYGIDARWHRLVRKQCSRILAIDDLADRTLEVQSVLDQNRDPSIALKEYAPYVDSEAMIMAGPTWALLRDEFRNNRSSNWSSPHDPPRVLVVMGGSDPNGLTSKVIDSLEKASRPIELVVVVGDPDQAKDLQVYGDLLEIRVAESNMASLMASVDLAISASGSTVWELCCMGVPMALIAQEPNQAAVVQQAVASGAAISILAMTESRIVQAVDTMLNEPGLLESMSQAGQLLVDGNGVRRVCEAMVNS